MDDDLLNEAPCGFVSFTDDGTVQAANATLLRLLDYAEEHVRQRHIGALLTVGSRVFYQTHLFPLLKMHGKVEEIYLSLRSRGGEDVPVLLNAVRRERNGAPISDCILVVMRQRSRFEDEILLAKKAALAAVHEKERAYAALAQAHEELEEANVELEAQQEELQTQQEQLLDLNVRLHARAEREALLNRIGRALRGQMGSDPEAILTTAVTLLGEALHVDRCYVTEYDMDRDLARVRAEWRRRSDLPPLRGAAYRISDFDLDLARGYRPEGVLMSRDVRAVDKTGHPVCSATAASALSALGIRAGVSIALFAGDARLPPVASFTVTMANDPRDWTRDEIALVQEVAVLTRSVAEEVRLREKALRIANQLQSALQPALPRAVPGLKLDACYRVALSEASVGGDFYDGFPLERDCYALVVADLSGKGLPAAAQIATVRHMLRTVLYEPGTTAAQAVTRVNDMLTKHELLTGFATVFVGAYDATRRTLTYVNAGQEPGLFRCGATGEILRMEATGPVLGAVSGAVYADRVVHLAPGDVFALFTDGLTEAGLSRKDLLEIDGVADIFRASAADPTASAAEITARIMVGVEAAATPAGIRDDVCLLVARVTE